MNALPNVSRGSLQDGSGLFCRHLHEIAEHEGCSLNLVDIIERLPKSTCEIGNIE